MTGMTVIIRLWRRNAGNCVLEDGQWAPFAWAMVKSGRRVKFMLACCGDRASSANEILDSLIWFGPIELSASIVIDAVNTINKYVAVFNEQTNRTATMRTKSIVICSRR